MYFVRCGVRTHALLREPELKSGALDHSANLTVLYKSKIHRTIYAWSPENILVKKKSKICFPDLPFKIEKC